MAEQKIDRKLNVIVVDDDALFRDEVSGFLGEEGFEVTAFESATHAERYMQSQPWSWVPKLIITDIVMEGMGGYQLMRRVNELYPNKNIPMIVLSRLYSADYVYEAEVAGASTYLQKPLHPDKLLAAIDKVLTKKVGA